MSYGADQNVNFPDAQPFSSTKFSRARSRLTCRLKHPTKFELVINLKAAKQIGLTIPPNVLVRADRVIK